MSKRDTVALESLHQPHPHEIPPRELGGLHSYVRPGASEQGLYPKRLVIRKLVSTLGSDWRGRIGANASRVPREKACEACASVLKPRESR